MLITQVTITDHPEGHAIYLDGSLRSDLGDLVAADVRNGFMAPSLVDREGSAYEYPSVATLRALASEVDAVEADLSWFNAVGREWPESLEDVVRDDGDRATYRERTGGLPDAQLDAIRLVRSREEFDDCFVEEMPAGIAGDGTVTIRMPDGAYVDVALDGTVTDRVLDEDGGRPTAAQRASFGIVLSEPYRFPAVDVDDLEIVDGRLRVPTVPPEPRLVDEGLVEEVETPVFYIDADGSIAESVTVTRALTEEGKEAQERLEEALEH